MILRRLSQSMKEQNWAAIWIEFVLLVVGVFLGIQVSNWNAQRADQRRANELFVRLVDDLQTETKTLAWLRDYYETTVAYAKVALHGVEEPSAVDPEAFVIGAYQASQWQEPVSSRSTFDEIVATGALNLLGSAKTRALLVGYYEYDWTKSMTATSSPRYRELVRGAMPYEIQQAIVKACGDQLSVVGRTVLVSLPSRCTIDVPADEIERAAAALRATPGFEAALRYQLAENDVKVVAYSANTALTNLITAVKASVR